MAIMVLVITILFILGGLITLGAMKSTHFPGREDAF
jgi:hypothetical protein